LATITDLGSVVTGSNPVEGRFLYLVFV